MLLNKLRKVYIVGYARTPFGALCGTISQVPIHKLASATILKALERSQVEPNQVEFLIFGNSFGVGSGPCPLQKIVIGTGLNVNTKTHVINNLCCSGLDSVTLGYELIRGGKDVCIVGGVENMSQSPFLLRNIRNENMHLGNTLCEDSLLSDGYDFILNHRGLKKNNVLELFCKKNKLPRVDLDEYVINSFKRATHAYSDNLIQQELFPLIIKKSDTQKKSGVESTKIIVNEDEWFRKYNIDKICNLASESLVTNYNIAPLGDGACAIVLMSEQKMKELQLNPIAEILTYEHASVYPSEFPLSISHSIIKCLQKINKKSVEYYEIHESSAMNVLFNIRNLNLDLSCVNLLGGSLSLGNPTAASGTKALMSLITVMKNYDMTYGCVSINNHLGSATSIIIENV